LIAQRSTQAWFSIFLLDQFPALCIQRVDASWQRVRMALLQTVIALPSYYWQQTLMKDVRRGLHSFNGSLHFCHWLRHISQAFPGAGPTFAY
jgi:hypothetical protein